MSQKYQVVIQPEAQQGIEEAYLWFSNDSPRKARLWLEGLYKAILSLEQMPYRCSLAFENNFLKEYPSFPQRLEHEARLSLKS